MGQIVTINRSPVYKGHHAHGCCVHREINDAYFDAIVNTNCPVCLKKFIEDICYLGLFRHYWKPLVFRRNTGVFGYDTNKYDLKIELQIDEGYKNKYYVSRYHAHGRLIVTNKRHPEIHKEIELFSLHCRHDEKELAKSYSEKIKRFMDTVFAINLDRWDEILGSKDYYERVLKK